MPNKVRVVMARLMYHDMDSSTGEWGRRDAIPPQAASLPHTQLAEVDGPDDDGAFTRVDCVGREGPI
jgi:hypothetical protein